MLFTFNSRIRVTPCVRGTGTPVDVMDINWCPGHNINWWRVTETSTGVRVRKHQDMDNLNQLVAGSTVGWRDEQDMNLFSGHGGAVMDLHFSPFIDECIASASDDTTVKVAAPPHHLF